MLRSLFSLHQCTPLCLAAEGGHEDIVKCLLKKRAKVNIKYDDGVSIHVYEAIYLRVDQHSWLEFDVRSQIEIVMYHSKHLPSETVVKNHFIHLDALILGYFYNCCASLHQPISLRIAARQGHADIVNLLVDNGADMSSKDDKGVSVCY